MKNEKIQKDGWTISIASDSILDSTEVDDWASKLAFHMPEMVFGRNTMSFVHESGLSVTFNAFDALAEVEKESTVKVHASWSSRGVSMKLQTRDWTYSTTYKGSVSGAAEIKPSTQVIPLDELRRPDPILFFGESILYEDELHDNGIALVSAKVRVMPGCFFALLRFWLRVDNVEVRVRDTRIFHRFGSPSVLREYTSRRATYDELRQRNLPADNAALSDAQAIFDKLPIVLQSMEEIMLPVKQAE